MNLLLPLLLLFLVGNVHSAQNCSECVEENNVWCVETSECNENVTSCTTPISIPLNCPSLPDPRYGYDDEFVRSQMMVIATAAQNENPQLCFDNQIPTMKLFAVRTVNCSDEYPDITCVGYTAYDVKQRAIVVAFKGAHGQNQQKQLGIDSLKYGMKTYFNGNGKIFKVIYDSFMLLWNGGMGQDLRQLKYKYPDFELWITGHSLGALLSFTASSFIASIGLYRPEDTKVVALGAGRIGDYDFAAWHSATFPYSYHVVHRRDATTRYPSVDPHSGTKMYQPRTEVWYDNYMKVGDPYIVCEEADGDYCSNAVMDDLLAEDHLYYFNINLPEWGHAGCPKNVSAYAQPQ